MTNSTALAQRNQTQLSQEVQKTAVDPEIIALASAFFTAGEMTKEQAVKAAYFFYQTGHVEGRDDYIGTTGGVRGKVLEGYRGVAREVGRDYEVKYRRPTVAEIEEHGIDHNGKALVCEVYVLDIWQRKQRMGLPYEPVIGIAYYPPGVKINVPATKTEHWVLQKNARKDALRQVPGVPLDADEVFAEAAAMGITAEVPEGAQPSAEQARLMVAQAQADNYTVPTITTPQPIQPVAPTNEAPPATFRNTPRPWTADMAIDAIKTAVEQDKGKPVDEGLWGALVGTLDSAPFNTQMRHELIDQVFGVQSTKDLNSAQRNALLQWSKITKSGNEKSDPWVIDSNAQQEYKRIIGSLWTDDGWSDVDAAGHDAEEVKY